MPAQPVPQRTICGTTRALYAPALLAALMAGAAPALAQSNAFAVRQSGDGYTFDVPVPASFLAAISDPKLACQNTTQSTVTSAGKASSLRVTEISWNSGSSIDAGRFAFSNGGGFEARCWATVATTDPEWQVFANHLKNIGTLRESIGTTTVSVVLQIGQAGDATLSLNKSEWAVARFQAPPLPQTQLPGESAEGLTARQAIVRSLDEVKLGTYFAGDLALVPTDLAAVRKAMLNYGKSERRRLDRTAITGARIVPAVGGSFRLGNPEEGKTFTVTTQGDLTLDERLNEAAQWFAEASAAGKANQHDFTGTWTVDGRTVEMAKDWHRVSYFQAPTADGEIVGSGGPGGFPYYWMAGNTHLAWYFGVGGPYEKVGYGAALAPNGSWHYVGLATSAPAAGGTATAAKPVTLTGEPNFQTSMLQANNELRTAASRTALTWDGALATQAQGEADRRIQADAPTAEAISGGFNLAMAGNSAAYPGSAELYKLGISGDWRLDIATNPQWTTVGCGTAGRLINGFYNRLVVCRYRN